MPCKVAGCKQMTLYKIVKGKSKWTIGDEASVKPKGFPMKPIEPLDLCYYHNKLNGGLFDGETYGRGSGSSKHRGRERIYYNDRE